MLDADEYYKVVHVAVGAMGKDINPNHTSYNLQGYFPRVKNINTKLLPINTTITNLNMELIKLYADKEVHDGLIKAAEEGLEQAANDFLKLFEMEITSIENGETDNDKMVSLVEEYITYKKQYNESNEKLNTPSTGLVDLIKQKESDLREQEALRDSLLEQKSALNKLFFETYSSFIQEGTWIKEDYIDDEKYYNDALSVMYNSCYPQVQYSINILELSALPGYELFSFELGDKTHVVDPDFFGSDLAEEIVLTEMVENLDDPSKNSAKVQNFKNQFQDLFQKITATV
jgi:hypothetical protein